MFNHTCSVGRMASLLALMLLLATAFAPSGSARGLQSTVRIENESSYAIARIFISSNDDPYWRSDVLGDSILWPGWVSRIQLSDGLYDLKLVDEDGDSCIVPAISVDGDTTWHITNRWLLRCEFH